MSRCHKKEYPIDKRMAQESKYTKGKSMGNCSCCFVAVPAVPHRIFLALYENKRIVNLWLQYCLLQIEERAKSSAAVCKSATILELKDWIDRLIGVYC